MGENLYIFHSFDLNLGKTALKILKVILLAVEHDTKFVPNAGDRAVK